MVEQWTGQWSSRLVTNQPESDGQAAGGRLGAATSAQAAEKKGSGETLAEWLQRLDLVEYQKGLEELGASSLVHVAQLRQEDLQPLGMPPLHQRSILEHAALLREPGAATVVRPSML